jgi:hypothetical protein
MSLLWSFVNCNRKQSINILLLRSCVSVPPKQCLGFNTAAIKASSSKNLSIISREAKKKVNQLPAFPLTVF